MQLVVSQPAISKAIAEMKHALGALPFDHSAHSVGLAECGPQLVERGRIIFDEIKQGATKIEELCDPPRGHVKTETAGPLTVVVSEIIAQRRGNIPGSAFTRR